MSGKAQKGELMAQLDRYNRLLWAIGEHIRYYESRNSVDFLGEDVASGLSVMVKQALKGINNDNPEAQK